MRNDDPKVTKVIASDYHRNGISGHGFTVTIAEMTVNGQKRRMLVVDFGKEAEKTLGMVPVAAFDLDLLTKNDVAFAMGNSWRGDNFAEPIRKAVRA